MRILILQDYLRGGGTESQSVELARRFHAQGDQVELLTFRPRGPLAERLESAGVAHKSLQPLDFGLNFWAPGLFSALRRFRPQVILCMGLMANCYAGFIQHRFPETAVVGTVRTGKPLPLLYAWSLRQVSGVLTNTEWWRPRLIGLGVEPGRIAVVANGSTRDWPLAKRREVRRRTREALGVDDSTVVFLNVAEFRRGKRQARLIEFFSDLSPDWDGRLLLVGGGREWRKCRRLADRLDPRRIHLTGYQPDPFDWYCAADVCVSASLEDSLPNFLVEAQSLGLPVIATDFKGVGEALRHGETGYLVSPRDTEAFSAAVRELSGDGAQRREMSRKAAARAAEHYAGPVQVGRTYQAIDRFHSLHFGLKTSHA